MSHTARYAAARAVATVAARFPDTPLVEPNVAALGAADTRLATAIFRTTLQRWLTLEHLLNRFTRQPVERSAPEAQAALLTGAAQLVFMDRLPGYAVIDESVEIVKQLGQKRASGMVNAVLRKLDGVVVERVDGMWEGGGWEPAVDRLPGSQPGGGGGVSLNRPMLPKPDNMLAHLVVATSHPLTLLQGWFKAFGREGATRLALHSLQNPPTFVTGPDGSTVWEGGFDELAGYLAEHPDERVQDPTAARAVASTADLSPNRILDLCAGRGTKTRQLRTLHPDAAIVAWDPDDERRADLEQVQGVEVREPGEGERFDLIVLDVPCSNTGVLARRPAARYRFNPMSVASLVKLQREIMARAIPLLAPGGRLLYSTCSIEAAENGGQAAWLVEQLGPGAAIQHEALTLPGGTGPTYHDGGYHTALAVSR